ncbi:MAG: aminoacyl-tRNA hydrolase [Hyphococcus sp.]|nr:MAG: aminoacyl-tRNA hydrolase [Marinicaulis sp.]
MPLKITSSITIPDWELVETFMRASGPGGQNVNKVETAVQLRFDVTNSPSLEPSIKTRLKSIAGRRMTKEGVLIIEAKRFRSQERNREDARARLASLVQRALTPPKPRKKKSVSPSQKRKRLEGKRRRSEVKAGRQRPAQDD